MAKFANDILTKETSKLTVFNPKYRVQWIAVFSTHIITFSHGVAIGWFSPTLLKLQSTDNTPLNFTISVEEASWVGTCWGIGSLLGIILVGFVIRKVGRKSVMIFLAFPHMASWFFIYFAKNTWYFYAARILAGSSGGAIFQVMPLYASEISDTCVRGALTTLIMTIGSVGTLMGYVISSFLDYFLIPWIVLFFPIIFLFALSTLPETPHYLLKSGKLIEAERSYCYYKRITSEDDPEMENFESLKNYFVNQSLNHNITWRDLTNKTALKAILMAFVLSAGNQFTGCFSITQYMSYIFQAADTTMDVNVCTLVVGFIQILATLLGVISVDIIGRRRIMLTSIGGMGTGWVILGLYIQYIAVDVKIKYAWMPLAIMIFIVFAGSVGFISLITVIVVESFPTKIRSTGLMIMMLFLSGSLTIQLKIYLYELTYFGATNTMYIAGGVCGATLLYVIFNLEETKNKQIDFD